MFSSLQKHVSVFREALKADKANMQHRQERREKDFLPAAIEVMETPASPAGRAMMWCLVAFFTIVMTWAWFSEIDVVATAPGKTLPRERVKEVQSAESGVIRAIHVENGQRVSEGQVLIELDPTIATADVDQASQNLLMAETELAKTRSLVTYIETGQRTYEAPNRLAAASELVQRQLINSRISEYDAMRRSYLERGAELQAELKSILFELDKITETLPLVEERLDARQELFDKGLSSKLLLLETKEQVIAQRRNRDIQSEQKAKTEAAIASLAAQAEQYRQEYLQTVISEMADAHDQMLLYQAEVNKADRRSALQVVRAPVGGTVQELSLHTVGGIVEAAKSLMVIVPEGGDLMVEAMVLNRDIGTVRVGDQVEVKLEAFPFTKHGVITGNLENLSLDAIEDENLGLVYAARVKLARDTIDIENKQVRLTSGMAATAEIKTGKRRLIEFILSPLLRYRDEALRER